MRMTLVGGARKPPECLFIRPRAPDTRRIKRTKIKLSLAISGLRGLKIAIGHFPIGPGIRGIGNGVRNESGTEKNCQKSSLHEILQDSGKCPGLRYFADVTYVFLDCIAKTSRDGTRRPLQVQETRHCATHRAEPCSNLVRFNTNIELQTLV